MKKNTSKDIGKYRHLNLSEREEIAIWLENGLKQCEIAFMLGRAQSSISREIKRNRSSIGVRRYRASFAQFQTDKRKKLSHKRKRIPQKIKALYMQMAERRVFTGNNRL